MSAARFSVPGRPIVLTVDTDPELALTPRQRQYVIALRSTNWNHSRAARLMGVDVSSVQDAIGYIRAAGVHVPRSHPGRPLGAADLTPRKVRP